MKSFISLVTVVLISNVSYASNLFCQGIRQATAICKQQGVQLNLDIEQGVFELKSLVGSGYKSTTPNDPCYELSSGDIVRTYSEWSYLAAKARVKFVPNYGGLPLLKTALVGDISIAGEHIILNDRMTGQRIQLSCH